MDILVKKGDIFIADLSSESEDCNPNNQCMVLVIKTTLKAPDTVRVVRISKLKEQTIENPKSDVIPVKVGKYLDVDDSVVYPDKVHDIHVNNLLKYIGTVDYSTVNEVKEALKTLQTTE
jgi:mRNA-degrading endonuclease toxin of MazEF toxin-antitoxin module